MVTLPTGTVTMVFTDVEGSTALLSRLGSAYAETMDVHRLVLRRAWVTHGGTEMGTEGDSFFVVFSSAPDAVAAVVQAQLALVAAEWPEGQQVRVRMGVHTGSPVVHGDGYVGMDVHRAARIAAAAHGGQVVVSEATARLVERAELPGVELVDLGWHRLKDMGQPERLFQVAGDGLGRDFAPLKSLGTASTLPRPATALVGRDDEVAELTALVASAGVRLVTLTGPGGSGKTRLAIGVAQASISRFPDGVYFIPLASATSAEVMWSTMGETLDAPPQARVPPTLFASIGQRALLLVLDNLEQIPGADAVTAELLDQASHVVVIATTRRALNVAGERQHAVPPLALPTGNSVEKATESAAVQLFNQHAQSVKSTFTITADNVADVVAVCTRLDGLPLAIELAAARTKLLSPRALLTRLDRALDLTAPSGQVPSRQKTLRDTIGWSYQLLTPTQQAFFCRLSVFSGGSDLQALRAVAADDPDDEGAKVLDLVSDLVEASLVHLTESPDGEPRVHLLETIRTYALDQLDKSGERALIQRRHAEYFYDLCTKLAVELESDRFLPAASQFDIEHDNLREALAWTLRPRSATAPSAEEEIRLGMRLALGMVAFWLVRFYMAEHKQWMIQAIECARGIDSPELANCLGQLAASVLADDPDLAHRYATEALDMKGRLNDRHVAELLSTFAWIEIFRDQPQTARSLIEQAVAAARESDPDLLMWILGAFAELESTEHHYDQARTLIDEALDLARERKAHLATFQFEHGLSCLMRVMGDTEVAASRLRDSIPEALQINDAGILITLGHHYSAAMADLGDCHLAVRLRGAVDAECDRLDFPRTSWLEEDIAEQLAKTRSALTSGEWDDLYHAGRNSTLEDALRSVPQQGIS